MGNRISPMDPMGNRISPMDPMGNRTLILHQAPKSSKGFSPRKNIHGIGIFTHICIICKVSIYPHLPYVFWKILGKYTIPMDPMGMFSVFCQSLGQLKRFVFRGQRCQRSRSTTFVRCCDRSWHQSERSLEFQGRLFREGFPQNGW